MTLEPTYKRSQLEYAQWGLFTYGTRAPSLPQIFRTRIKRLLELDRARRARQSETPSSRFAFQDHKGEGRGSDVPYTAFNAFCLALALDMLDIGFKQSEVVFLLRNIRPALQQQHRIVLSYPWVPRSRIPAEQIPEAPRYTHERITYGDPRIFMALRKIELKEVIPPALRRTRSSIPLIVDLEFIGGVEALRQRLDRMNYDVRKEIIVELYHTAHIVAEKLREAPLTGRGRRARG